MDELTFDVTSLIFDKLTSRDLLSLGLSSSIMIKKLYKYYELKKTVITQNFINFNQFITSIDSKLPIISEYECTCGYNHNETKCALCGHNLYKEPRCNYKIPYRTELINKHVSLRDARGLADYLKSVGERKSIYNIRIAGIEAHLCFSHIMCFRCIPILQIEHLNEWISEIKKEFKK